MNYIMNFFWKSSQQTQPTVQPSSKTINSSNKSASTTTISTTESQNDQHDKTEIVQMASNTGDYQPFFLNLNNKKRTPSINNGDNNNNIEAVGSNFTLPSISSPSPRISNKFSSNPSSLLNPNISTKDLQSKLNNLKEKLNETTISSTNKNGNVFC
jgi:hypothetical protein